MKAVREGHPVEREAPRGEEVPRRDEVVIGVVVEVEVANHCPVERLCSEADREQAASDDEQAPRHSGFRPTTQTHYCQDVLAPHCDQCTGSFKTSCLEKVQAGDDKACAYWWANASAYCR